MIKKTLTVLLCAGCTCFISATVPAHSNDNTRQNQAVRPDEHAKAAQRDALMQRDEIDDTDTYAIPLDSSEIEDEEEINRLEQKKVFNLGR